MTALAPHVYSYHLMNDNTQRLIPPFNSHIYLSTPTSFSAAQALCSASTSWHIERENEQRSAFISDKFFLEVMERLTPLQGGRVGNWYISALRQKSD